MAIAVPKLDSRSHLGIGSRFRLLLRFLGLTALVAAGVGALVLQGTEFQWSIEALKTAVQTHDPFRTHVAAVLVLGGAAIVLFTLLVEVFTALLLNAGGKSIAGTNALVQVLLAIGLLAGVNYYSFEHYARKDTTRDRRFTLPQNIADELGKLRGETTIVVLQQHETIGRSSEKPDAYDYAAEREVVNKVNDLVDQFREFGSQFHVVLLDVQDVRYEDKLNDLCKDKKGLREEILAAPENSIFFYTDGKVQRLGFNEFYLLDKTASQEKGRENLVLRPQGVEPFARNVLAIDQKKPRVVLAVIHPVLTTADEVTGDYTSRGLGKALKEDGCDVTNIILRYWGAKDAAAAYNPAEGELDKQEKLIQGYEGIVRYLKIIQKKLGDLVQELRNSTLKDLQKEAGDSSFNEEDRQLNIDLRERAIKSFDSTIQLYTAKRDEAERTIQRLRSDERMMEDQRITDVRTRFTRTLADADLLIVPRLTILDAPEKVVIRRDPRDTRDPWYSFSPDQTEAVREFIKAGKPVLACLGPTNVPPDGPDIPPDGLEKLLADLGIELGGQTILFDQELDAFLVHVNNEFPVGKVSVPPVLFEGGGAKEDHPLSKAMQTVMRGMGRKSDVELRAPRPIYAVKGVENASRTKTEFLFTAPESWNKDEPFGSAVGPPLFEPTPKGDPKKNTNDEERRGPFPIGVAIEVLPPVEWYDQRYTGAKQLAGLVSGLDHGLLAACLTKAAEVQFKGKRKPTRLVVIGHGGVFTGQQLSPSREMMLVNSVNWLLDRDVRMPRTDAPVWEYPRVSLSSRAAFMWRWGLLLGPPVFFAYLGCVVLMFRKVR